MKNLRKALAKTPERCPVCLSKDKKLQWSDDADFQLAYAKGVLARISWAASVAEAQLGWTLPWQQHLVAHFVAVPTETGIGRLMLSVGEKRYAENIRMSWPCPEYETLCQTIALDLAEANPAPGYTATESREALGKQLRMRWGDADFHVCGKSKSIAVMRALREFREFKPQ